MTEYRLIYAGQLSPIAKVDGSGNVMESYIYESPELMQWLGSLIVLSDVFETAIFGSFTEKQLPKIDSGANSPAYILKDGTKYRVIKDHLGSIRMIVNTSTGEVVKTLRYSEFGEITEEAGTFETIFGFAGGIRDTDTGLTKFGARWYDPETGRWLEKEPLGFKGSDNFYSYCDGDPVNYVDVAGEVKSLIGPLLKILRVAEFKECFDDCSEGKEDENNENKENKENETCNSSDPTLKDAEKVEKDKKGFAYCARSCFLNMISPLPGPKP